MTVTQTTWNTTPLPLRPPTPRAPAAPAFMTHRDVAAACKLSETAVRRAISEGELPAAKLRSRLRITRADFDVWIASQRHAPTRPAPPQRTAPRAPRVAPAGRFRALLHADTAQAQTR